jgi:predicted transcriptional regulator
MAKRRKEAFIGLRVDEGVRAKLEALAVVHERTLAAEIRLAIRRHIEAEESSEPSSSKPYKRKTVNG